MFTVDAYPGVSFTGTIKQVRLAPINVQNVVTYNVVVGVDNKDLRLKPGMTANVSIIVAQKDQVLKVPNAALRFMPPKGEGSRREPTATTANGHGGRPVKSRCWHNAFENDLETVREWRPHVLAVQTGISDGVTTEVLSGDLREGDLVVVGIEQPFGEKKGERFAARIWKPATPSLSMRHRMARTGNVCTWLVRHTVLPPTSIIHLQIHPCAGRRMSALDR